MALVGSSGWIEVAVVNGDAARQLTGRCRNHGLVEAQKVKQRTRDGTGDSGELIGANTPPQLRELCNIDAAARKSNEAHFLMSANSPNSIPPSLRFPTRQAIPATNLSQ